MSFFLHCESAVISDTWRATPLALHSQQEHGAWASTWLLVRAQTVDIIRQQQQRPKTLTWLQATDIRLAFVGSVGHRHQHKPLAAVAGPWTLRSASRAPITALYSITDGKHQHGLRWPGKLLSSTSPRCGSIMLPSERRNSSSGQQK